MSATDPAAQQARPPFSPRAVLALVVLGGIVFLAMLWMIGTGLAAGSTNDGGAHAGGKGLNGYAALAGYLERRGMTVRRSRSEGALDDPGLLVLTPPQAADGAELALIVATRRMIGPTMVITPKWDAFALPAGTAKAKQGWVQIGGATSPQWRGFLDELSLTLAPLPPAPGPALWRDRESAGRLPDPAQVQSGSGAALVPLVVDARSGRVLAGWLADGGFYPGLVDATLEGGDPGDGDDAGAYPVVVVFEPDLLDNYGFRDFGNARLAERLVRAATGGEPGPVIFDLTLNGLGRSANLLTLAFTPPFLAATLCLVIAGIAVAWRAFLRFGPPQTAGRAIAFGKRALVGNAAGLVLRSRRHHLIAAPYAEAVRARLVRELALPRLADAAATEAAIDRALAARQPGAIPFSAIAARLRAARRPHDLLGAARELHQLERMLTR